MHTIENFPNILLEPKNAALFSGILRGAEREALRTSYGGKLSQKPHPQGLGSALTHPQITTDFSESLLEFITPPTHRVEDLINHLDVIQRYTLSQLEDEILWTSSMPCILGDDDQIPIAQYGHSNNGKMKSIYRTGLGHRYGRAMQTVSGIHYNFSLPNAFWALLSHEENSIADLQEFKNQKYFSLIRNFRRHYWLLIYLFGASPALCKSFVKGKDHNLEELEDGHTLYLPYATSLRMGDLGYQSKTQESLYVCYNDIESYTKTLCCAITSSHKPYERIGKQTSSGDYLQLNTNILQIENEFYSAIRPKRTAQPGETALSALENRGVEYIEARCLDVDPFSPLGITKQQIRFLDTFLLYCAIKDSPKTTQEESQQVLKNQKKVVSYGREPGLLLHNLKGGEISLQEWGISLIEAMKPVAELLDESKSTNEHSDSLIEQMEKLTSPDLTPSARILQIMREESLSYPEFALKMSHTHNETLTKTPIDEKMAIRMEAMAEESTLEQKALESASTESLDSFLTTYYKQYEQCSQTK